MSKDYRIFPIPHIYDDYHWLVWSEGKMIYIGEARKDSTDPRPVKKVKISENDFFPHFDSSQTQSQLNRIEMVQITGLKEKLLIKFPLLFEPAPEPKRYA